MSEVIMETQLFSNNAKTVLAEELTIIGDTLKLDSATGELFPSPSVNEYLSGKPFLGSWQSQCSEPHAYQKKGETSAQFLTLPLPALALCVIHQVPDRLLP